MAASKFAEVQWPPLDRTTPGGELRKKFGEPDRSAFSSGRSATQAAGAAVARAVDVSSPPPVAERSRPGTQRNVGTEERSAMNEAHNRNHTPATEISSPAVARHGEGATAQTSLAATPYAPLKKVALPLLDELTRLESRCVDLAGRLSEVVQELLSGNVQAGAVAPELTALQTDVESFEKRTLDLAVSLALPSGATAGPSTLGELRATLKAAAEAEDRRDFGAVHDRAAQELEGVLALEYGGADSNPLAECQAAGRRLLEAIAGAQWPEANPESLPLAERRHAYSRLLDLVYQREELSDDDWQTAEETVTSTFGRRLAVAAVRGRLRAKNRQVASVQEVETCPTCAATLEPGAKFCGDCGVHVQ